MVTRMTGSLSKKALATISALAVTSAAFAAEIEVRSGATGPFEAWVLKELPSQLPADGLAFKNQPFKLTVPDGKSGFLLVKDGRGNVAWSDISSVKTSIWTIQSNIWKIGEVRVNATQGSDPLDGGMAVLEAKGWSASALISGGEALFFGVPPGEVSVSVQYLEGETKKATTPLKYTLALDRDEAAPVLAVAVPAGKAGEGKPEAKEGQAADKGGRTGRGQAEGADQGARSPVANAIVWLVALGIGIGALYALFRWLKANESKVAEKLRSVGVSVPDGTQSDDDGPDAPPGQAPPFDPRAQRPEPLPHEAFAPVGATGAAAPTPKPSAPRLLVQGATVEIPDGAVLLGREAGEGVILISDPTVSRKHAELRREGDAVIIRDVGSSNGTYVNGSRIEGETTLQPGDRIHLGSAELRFEA